MDHFPILILIGRPASGKSEIIDYLLHADPAERLRRFRISRPGRSGRFPHAVDLVRRRLSAQPGARSSRGYIPTSRVISCSLSCGIYWSNASIWNTTSVCATIQNITTHTTTIIEFSRGSEHGGYAGAFENLSDDLLDRAVIIYVRVSFAESLRKNRRRFNPE